MGARSRAVIIQNDGELRAAPQMHAGMRTEIRRHSRRENSLTCTRHKRGRLPIASEMMKRERRTYEPFLRNHLGLVRAIRKPESRLQSVAQFVFLRTFAP